MAKQLNAKECVIVERLRKRELIAAARGMLTNLPNDGAVAALKHGVLANQLLDQEERRVFYALIERFEADFTLNTSADYMEVELVTLYFIQLFRAVRAEEWESVQRIDGMLRSHLREMKASKRSRESDETQRQTLSAGEWTADLLAKAQAAGLEIRRAVAVAPA